ncbi:E3 ubiquitin-protein ligase PRP19, partial [Ascoidea rubescens DSM 1968]
MHCSISGEIARHPVLSLKSRLVYEKSLAHTYIEQNGTDPITNELASVEDLVEIRSPVEIDSNVVVPRPPSFNSIPNILSTLQNEFDSVILENFKLKKTLDFYKQNLSSSLYHYDASLRVINRYRKQNEYLRNSLVSILNN